MQTPSPDSDSPARRVSSSEEAFTRRIVTATMLTIAALTFAFSFGNVWSLGLRLGVAPWLAPLIGPAVDLSVIGLIVGVRHLALCGVRAAELRPARLLLAFSGLATLALNIAEPIAGGLYGKAAFDAVAPLLLIGWSEVGPGLLGRLQQFRHSAEPASPRPDPHAAPVDLQSDHDLVEEALRIDAEHRARTAGRPVSAETLRRELRISSARARLLAKSVRQ
ncbi:hypothetical protein ACIBG8_25900 [Nonomuraea sp. NPDC050556]|uniref:hypothetical protein n=1 Tax=Nonomuraea sp. NPDC050556 TaxID=3364369 RepID=UPI00378BAC18